LDLPKQEATWPGVAAGANAKALPACDYPTSSAVAQGAKADGSIHRRCVENDGYAVSLEKRKIYVALRDAAAAKHDMLRIVDESGEDYLYPKAFFRGIALPQAVKKAVLAA
jgi:hypothetical protein